MAYLKVLQENNTTSIINLKEIAQSLDIDEEVIIKYLSIELNTEYDKEFILKGHYTFTSINDLFRKFVEKYLDCPKCDKPNLYYGLKGDSCKMCHYPCDYKEYVKIETDFEKFFFRKCLARMFK